MSNFLKILFQNKIASNNLNGIITKCALRKCSCLPKNVNYGLLILYCRFCYEFDFPLADSFDYA